MERDAPSRHLRVLRNAGLVSAEVSGRERVFRHEIAPLAQVETYLAELRVPLDVVRNAWARRFMSLETEVHRVRSGGKATRTKAMDDRKRKAR